MHSRQYLYWALPLALLAIIIVLSGFIDMPIERTFYNYNTHQFTDTALTDFIYEHAINPGQIAGIASIIAFLLSYTRKQWKPWRKPALMLILTMAIGAGFITHTLLKDRWGRPRPKQVIEFGGQQDFRPIYKPNFFDQPEPSKAFPCGHCTMGFFFFAFFFLGKRLHRPWMSYLGLFLALSLGAALAYTRMAEGGHFLTDTLTAAIVMWLTAYTCDWILYGDEGPL